MIVVDAVSGPLGRVNMAVAAYLEVGGERFKLETAFSASKDFVSKWQRYSQMLNVPFQLTDNAQRFVS